MRTLLLAFLFLLPLSAKAPVTVVRPAFRPIIVASGTACDSVNDASSMAYWRLDEASGTREDTEGANDLTDNNTVASAAGKIGNAADFERDNSERLSIADNAALSLGADSDFTLAVWVNGESFPDFMVIAGKLGSFNGTSDEYAIYNTGGAFRFLVGNGSSFAAAESVATPITATWFFIVGWHDSGANTVNIQVNDATVASTSWSGGTQDTTNPFTIGGLNNGSYSWDGLIDEALFTKRVLTSSEITALYNSGNGCRPSGL